MINNVLIIFVLVLCAVLFFLWVRLSYKNDKKLEALLRKHRQELSKTYNDDTFPLIVSDPPKIGVNDPSAFEIRGMVNPNPEKNSWDYYIIAPAGIQSKLEIPFSELTITLGKQNEDYKNFLLISEPIGFISSRYITAIQEPTLYGKNHAVEDTLKLIENFRNLGATIKSP